MTKRQLTIGGIVGVIAAGLTVLCFILGAAQLEAGGRRPVIQEMALGEGIAKWLEHIDYFNMGSLGWSWSEWIHHWFVDVVGMDSTAAYGWPLMLGVIVFCISMGATAGVLMLLATMGIAWFRNAPGMREQLTRTRIIVALAVFILATGPLLGLAHLSRDVRYLDFFTKAFRNTDIGFPFLSGLLLPFGPLDWWSYITPVALAVAAASSLRNPIRPAGLACILAGSVLQFLIMFAVAVPYFYLTAVMGYFPRTHYPTGPLVANLILIAASSSLAIHAVWKLFSGTPR